MPFRFWNSRPPSRPNQLIIGLPAQSINSLFAGLQAITISWSLAGLHWPGSVVCWLCVARHFAACSFRVWQSVFPPPPPRHGQHRTGVWHFNSVKNQVSPSKLTLHFSVYISVVKCHRMLFFAIAVDTYFKYNEKFLEQFSLLPRGENIVYFM